MLYLLDKLDFELFGTWSEYLQLEAWETSEEKVKTWLENERSRSIFNKQEILDLFKPKQKIQMVQIQEIELKKFDRIIVFTPGGKFYAIRVMGFYK